LKDIKALHQHFLQKTERSCIVFSHPRLTQYFGILFSFSFVKKIKYEYNH
jgi:hypothetical protein